MLTSCVKLLINLPNGFQDTVWTNLYNRRSDFQSYWYLTTSSVLSTVIGRMKQNENVAYLPVISNACVKYQINLTKGFWDTAWTRWWTTTSPIKFQRSVILPIFYGTEQNYTVAHLQVMVNACVKCLINPTNSFLDTVWTRWLTAISPIKFKKSVIFAFFCRIEQNYDVAHL